MNPTLNSSPFIPDAKTWREGNDACCKGVAFDDNPYATTDDAAFTDPRAISWGMGFIEAERGTKVH